MMNYLRRLFGPKNLEVKDYANTSEDTPSEHQKRWDYLVKSSIIFDENRYISVDSIIRICEGLRSVGVVIREDNYLPVAEAKSQDRFGLTYYFPNQKPMIYLVTKKHEDEGELIDTILHEALHSSAPFLDRHAYPEEEVSSLGYMLEEICVCEGLNSIYKKMYFPLINSQKQRAEYCLDSYIRAAKLKTSSGTVADWQKRVKMLQHGL